MFELGPDPMILTEVFWWNMVLREGKGGIGCY